MEIESLDLSPTKSAVNWPSKISVLETPERKRFRHSVSFADSGLGSSLFNSPPDTEPMKPLKTSPLLRTPTDRSGQSVNGIHSTTTPSPIRSFVHMSSYSSAFSSPEVRQCSVSRRELRLSNPENATGYQFSGNSVCRNRGSPINVASGELITHSRPLSVKQYHFTTPSTSRASNRALVLPSPCGDDGAENDEMAADVTIPYAFPETPSKSFGIDSMDRSSVFGVEDFTDMATSTPLRDFVDNRGNHLGVVAFQAPFPRILEQASGPLESSVCDSFEIPPAVPALFTSPTKFSSSTSVERSRFVSRNFAKSAANEDITRNCFSNAQQPEGDVYAETARNKTNELCSSEPKPFKPPVKPLKPFSRLWSQITFGETKHQAQRKRHQRCLEMILELIIAYVLILSLVTQNFVCKLEMFE